MPDFSEKVIYVCTGTPVWQETARLLEQVHDWQSVLYVGFEKVSQIPSDSFFADVPFYSLDDARFSVEPTHLNNYKIASFDLKIFGELQDEFDLFMEMLERYTAVGHDGSYEQKKNFFIRMVLIWTGILDATEATKVVMGSRPHRLFDLVLEMLCKKRAIPAVIIEHTGFGNCCFAVNVHSGLSFPVDLIQPTHQSIGKDSRDFIDSMRKTYDIGKPVSLSAQGFFTQSRQKKEQTLGSLILRRIPPALIFFWRLTKSVGRGKLNTQYRTLLKFSRGINFNPIPRPANAYDLLYQRYFREKQIMKVRRWYKNNSVKADLNAKYIYFTASFQPERSSCPDSGRYHDLILALGLLVRNTPKDCKIYYKEHPRTFAAAVDHDAQRSVLFYEQIKSLYPQVEFIDSSYTPFDLIDNAYAVALAGGTTGWEALVRGKPCFLIGDIWYSGAKPLFIIKNNQDVKKGFERIAKENSREDNLLEDYILALEDVSDDLLHFFESNISYRSQVQNAEGSVIKRNETEEAADLFHAELAAKQIIRASSYSLK